MKSPVVASPKSPQLSPREQRQAALLNEHQLAIYRKTDRLFAVLLVFEWMAAIVLAAIRSPRTWNGAVSSIHPHIWVATLLEGLIVSLPLWFVWKKPGETLTRHVIAVAQMLTSAVLIHLGDGQIEMHFHVFGSLAFLAFYRDWRVLVTASAVVAAHHLVRGTVAPLSVYGVDTAILGRTLEHVGWVVFEDVFLVTGCMQGVRELMAIAERQALLEESHTTVEEKVRERTLQLEQAQANLVNVARSAGMAEIATSVLHNVGNVLNSVNVSVNLAASKVRQSPVDNLMKAVEMMKAHEQDLGAFMTDDVKGRQLAPFLGAVAEVFHEEQASLLQEMASLSKNVDHIKHIVNIQQSHARCASADVLAEEDLAAIIEDALSVNGLATGAGGVSITRDFEPLMVSTNKHALLQILINILRNAKQAVSHQPAEQRRITVRVRTTHTDGRHRAAIDIQDNGVGINPADLTRIFNHGFTTKEDGHGFGLHSSAISAKQLGGSLAVRSDGPGSGATFTLDIPVHSQQVHA